MPTSSLPLLSCFSVRSLPCSQHPLSPSVTAFTMHLQLPFTACELQGAGTGVPHLVSPPLWWTPDVGTGLHEVLGPLARSWGGSLSHGRAVAHPGSDQVGLVAHGVEVWGWRWPPCETQKTTVIVNLLCVFRACVSAAVTSFMLVGTSCVSHQPQLFRENVLQESSF